MKTRARWQKLTLASAALVALTACAWHAMTVNPGAAAAVFGSLALGVPAVVGAHAAGNVGEHVATKRSDP